MSIIPFGSVGFGCMGMTAFYGNPMASEDSIKLLQGIYELYRKDNKFPHFDTAEIYKTGNPFADGDDIYNEQVLAPFLSSVPRETYTIATKFMPFKYGGACDYETVKGALERSLKRLGLSYVDIYYCHRIPSLEGAVSFAQACERLVSEGLMRHIGLSEINGSWLRQVHNVVPIAAVQQEWSILTRNLELELVPVCSELGIGIVAYSPLSRNLLSCPAEKPTDWRQSNPRFSDENWAKNIALIEKVKLMADSKGVTAAQLSLAWIFHKAKELGVKVLPIPGTTKLTNAASNHASVGVEFTSDEAAALEDLAQQIAGARGDEQYLSMGIEGQQ